MVEIGERIRRRREELKMTQEELAQKMGYKSRSSVNKIEKGENDIPQIKIKRFAQALDTTPLYLLGLEDDPERAKMPVNVVEMPPMKRVPLVGTIACGEPILAEQNIEGEVSVPENVHADFCLRCKGDSMTGARINDGDLVFIRQQPTVDDGQIAAVLIGDEATLKRVYHQGEILVLSAENPAYKPMICTPDQDIRVLGLAVAFLSTIS